MAKENLPQMLIKRNLGTLGLIEPRTFESENDLFIDAPQARSAIVYLPKSKPLIEMTLSIVSASVAEGGVVVLAGMNDSGIRSAKEAFEKNIGPVDQKLVGNHSALYAGKNMKLGADKRIDDYLKYFPLEYKKISLEIADLPGVFSAGELDEGTKLLLEHIPYDRKAVLDVGCGAGTIGALYKKIHPESDVSMSDASKLALYAARMTLQKNKLEANIIESDVFSGISGTFDLIVCNPPFHKGISTNYSFIEKFAKDAKKRLNRDGEIYIVANSFLPYEDSLSKGIGSCEVIADNKKFKVIRCGQAAL